MITITIEQDELAEMLRDNIQKKYNIKMPDKTIINAKSYCYIAKRYKYLNEVESVYFELGEHKDEQ